MIDEFVRPGSTRPPQRTRPRPQLLLLVLLPLTCAATAAAPRFDAEIAVTQDDNVTRAQRDIDIEQDSFLALGVGASHAVNLGASQRIVFRGTVLHEAYREFDGLSNTTASFNTTYQYRSSGAFRAPTYSLFAKAGIAEYESELRDSNLYSLGASLRAALTDRIVTTLAYSANRRDSDSTVFDTREKSLLLNLDYALASRSTLYLTYNRLDGDIVSTGEPWLAAVNAADAINADDAFGGTAANRFAYRLQAQTDVVTLGLNFELSGRQSLDLSARQIDSDAAGNLYYKRSQIGLAYLVRF